MLTRSTLQHSAVWIGLCVAIGQVIAAVAGQDNSPLFWGIWTMAFGGVAMVVEILIRRRSKA